jgi:hypothetical protein
LLLLGQPVHAGKVKRRTAVRQAKWDEHRSMLELGEKLTCKFDFPC